jgi:hypothetical protein
MRFQASSQVVENRADILLVAGQIEPIMLCCRTPRTVKYNDPRGRPALPWHMNADAH